MIVFVVALGLVYGAGSAAPAEHCSPSMIWLAPFAKSAARLQLFLVDGMVVILVELGRKVLNLRLKAPAAQPRKATSPALHTALLIPHLSSLNVSCMYDFIRSDQSLSFGRFPSAS